MDSMFWHSLKSGPHGNLVVLVRYGSDRSGGDIDYLAVYDRPQLSSCIILGGLDLWATHTKELDNLASLLDPVVTEPLLTGQVVAGDSAIVERAAQIVNRSAPDTLTSSHLLRRSFRAYLRSIELSELSGDSASIYSRDYWSSLSFAISYWSFASEYQLNWNGVLSLADLIEKMPRPVRELWEHVKESKVLSKPLDVSLVHEWSNLLSRLSVNSNSPPVA